MTDPREFSFKAYEIEELADVYFFRPLGLILARAARALKMSPAGVTAASAAAGVAGGALLYREDVALAGASLIVFHSVLDSADGQLARMTGRESELGRLLDGLAGFAMHAAVYVAIMAAAIARGALVSQVIVFGMLAAVATLAHAQMYDYHRSAYVRVALKGRAERQPSRGLVRVYEAVEGWLAWSHRPVEQALARRSSNGIVGETDRARYRQCFYSPVRGWNALGDNTRIYAVCALAWFQHLDFLFAFVLVPMNILFGLLVLWQARADRRFLAGL